MWWRTIIGRAREVAVDNKGKNTEMIKLLPSIIDNTTTEHVYRWLIVQHIHIQRFTVSTMGLHIQ